MKHHPTVGNSPPVSNSLPTDHSLSPDDSRDRVSVILDALALRVRMLSLEQVARTWWASNRQPAIDAHRSLDRLIKSGMLAAKTVLAYPMIELSEPALRWQPGDPEPEFGAIAYKLQSRWPQVPQRLTEVYMATPRLANRLGGFRGHLQHRDQVTHDLHVSELYLRRLQSGPATSIHWKGEELRKRGQEYGEKLPDAMLVDETGVPRCAIEFGGRYPKKRIRDFHNHCVQHGLPYELW